MYCPSSTAPSFSLFHLPITTSWISFHKWKLIQLQLHTTFEWFEWNGTHYFICFSWNFRHSLCNGWTREQTKGTHHQVKAFRHTNQWGSLVERSFSSSSLQGSKYISFFYTHWKENMKKFDAMKASLINISEEVHKLHQEHPSFFESIQDVLSC